MYESQQNVSGALPQQFGQQFPQQAQQFSPQGLLGGLLGGPLGGLAGKGIGSLFGNPQLGQQIGQFAGGIGGSLLPFGADPVSQFYAQQQQQFAPQGWLGNAIGALAQPVGGLIGGAFGNQGLGQQIGGIAGQLGRMLPFGADPVSQFYAQQGQQGQQFGPQGWLGNAIGTLAQPVGGLIGGAFGNQGLGQQIGGIAGQLGRMLPFSADPSAQFYAQQLQGQQGQQMSPQGLLSSLLAQRSPTGIIANDPFGNIGIAGRPLGGIISQPLPFSVDPVAAYYAQQQQLPQMQQGYGQGGNTMAPPTLH